VYKDWKSEYEKKLVTPEEAANLVQSGQRVVFTSGRESFAVGLSTSFPAAVSNNLFDLSLIVDNADVRMRKRYFKSFEKKNTTRLPVCASTPGSKEVFNQ